MKFDTPAARNPIGQLKVVGKPVDRIDGPLKTTGTATYAYEWQDPRSTLAYGYGVGSAPPRGGGCGQGRSAPPIHRVGDFEGAFAAAPVKIDEWYGTPDQSHAMM